MILPIYHDKHPVLRQIAEPIKEITPDILQLAADMRETMHNAKGVGLAAPQVGKSISMIVIELNGEEDPRGNIPLLTLINPRVTWFGPRKTYFSEGCLSIPGYEGEVCRPERIRVKAIDLEGKEIRISTDGFLARVLQHEIDHLNGKLFIDYLPAKALKKVPIKDFPRI